MKSKMLKRIAVLYMIEKAISIECSAPQGINLAPFGRELMLMRLKTYCPALMDLTILRTAACG